MNFGNDNVVGKMGGDRRKMGEVACASRWKSRKDFFGMCGVVTEAKWGQVDMRRPVSWDEPSSDANGHLRAPR